MSSILVDDVPTEIELKPITLLCHKGDVHLEPDGQVLIGPEETIARAAEITQEEWESFRDIPKFADLFHKVFKDMKMPDVLAREGMGVRHVVGLIVMMFELKEGQTPFIRYPESFLHPSAQSGLAYLFVSFTNAGAK
ncbi:MAG: hypothetical protein V4621_07865 [Pseudomonadota bacterium]